MKKKRKKWVILLCLIALAIGASGYYVYNNYFSKQEDIILNEIEDDEEITLGDNRGVCRNSSIYSLKKTCKNVKCSSKTNASACNAANGCCSWTQCNIKACKSYKLQGGQCRCTSCQNGYEVRNSGMTCEPKKTNGTCCISKGAGKYATGAGLACSNAILDGNYVHSGSCVLCENVNITIPPKASQNRGITVSGSVSGDRKLETGLTCTWSVSGGGKKAELKCGGTGSCEATLTGFSACTKVNVTASGPTTKSGTVEIETKFTDELENKTLKSTDIIPTTERAADDNGKSYYGSEENCVTNPDGSRDCLLHIRSNCGTRYNFCCVDNGTLLTSTEAKYMINQPSKTCPKGYTLLDGVSKENCAIKNDLGSCDTTSVSSPKKKLTASICEDTVNMSVDEGKQCTNVINNQKNSFYEISCAKTVKTSFDYGNDGYKYTERVLYRGEGFAFGVNINTTVNCKYTFYDSVWKTAYNNVMNRIKAINSNLVRYVEKNDKTGWENYINKNILNKNGINNSRELYRLWGIVEDLRNIVDAYNKYKPNEDYKEQGKITIKTKENGREVNNKYDLVQIVKNEGSYKMTNVVGKNLSAPLVTNPKNYVLSSSTPREVVLIPKKVCINKVTGEVVSLDSNGNCPNRSIDGGNKIYLSHNTDVTGSNTSYTIVVDVDGLGSNNSEIKDDKCTLKVGETTFIYRPIDVGNPFINSSWEKGMNWVNDIYDFTQIIHANTWSESTYRKVTLSASDIEAIKKSNKDNRDNSPYLGLCDNQNVAVQDNITRKLCEAIQ